MNKRSHYPLTSKPISVKTIVLGSSGAGKTSFLRRFFNGNFSRERRSTIGSDFYSSIIPNPIYRKHHSCRHLDGTETLSSNQTDSMKKKGKKKKKSKKRKKEIESFDNESERYADIFLKEPFVALQMWDTAGKERFVSESTGLTSRLGDSFFRHANVAILVYDGTSSRSFLQLIKWHTELRERMNRVWSMDPKDTPDFINKDHFNPHSQNRRLPVLVVATHVDIILAEESRVTTKRKVEQRGFMPKEFNGMDNHYEYTTVELHSTDNANQDDEHAKRKNKKHVKNSQMKDANLSFGLEASGRWAGDKSYIDHVKLAEDECFPDRNMVKRWCKRNGLGHIEVSSLDGRGIQEAVTAAIKLALLGMSEQKKFEDASKTAIAYDDDGDAASHRSINLLERYKQQHDSCSFCRFLVQHYIQRCCNFRGST